MPSLPISPSSSSPLLLFFFSSHSLLLSYFSSLLFCSSVILLLSFSSSSFSLILSFSLQVDNMDSYNFQPRTMLTEVGDIIFFTYCNMAWQRCVSQLVSARSRATKRKDGLSVDCWVVATSVSPSVLRINLTAPCPTQWRLSYSLPLSPISASWFTRCAKPWCTSQNFLLSGKPSLKTGSTKRCSNCLDLLGQLSLPISIYFYFTPISP